MTNNKPTYHELELRNSQLEKEIESNKALFEGFKNKLNEIESLAKIGHWELDLVSNKLSWSDEIYRIFGCKPQEFGATYELFLSFIPVEDKEFVNASYVNHLHSAVPYDIIHRIQLLNGAIKYVNEKCHSEFDVNGKPLRSLGTVADITERILFAKNLQSAEYKSESTETHLKTLINMLPDLIWLKDVNGVYLNCNQRFEDFFGAKENDIVGKTDFNFMESDLAEFFRLNDKIAMRAGKPMINEEEILFANDGHKEYLETIKTPLYGINEELIGVLGVGRDITRRKEIEHELIAAKERAEENELKFKAAFYTSPDSININKLNGEYVEINEGFTHLTGFTKEDVIGKLSLEINIWSKPEDREKLIYALKNKGYIENLESLFRAKNGSLIPALMSAKIIMLNNEPHILSVTREISERKKFEQELIIAKEKAEESDRLKTAFLQNMSHEIRTPLNAISGFSGLLSKPNLSEEKRNSFVQIIQSSSNQLVSVVTDILTISSLETKQEKINISVVCINNVIVDLLTIFKQQALSQNISLYAKQQLSDKQSEIYSDKTKIIQIVTNLLTNALKFTHEGFIEFGYNLKGNDLEFYVKDSGIGIKTEFHASIFERFRQANKSINKLYGGTGLGLAISKAFVELLGGKIWVESELEKGSIFYFTIPYAPVNENEKNSLPTSQKENFKIVLVAEDVEYNFLFIEELLIYMNLKLIHAKDGKETVEIFKSNSHIDLILMDIKMPIMTGHEAAIIIKELNPNIPIVAQSAYALEHERAKYEGIFDDYLTKPINENDLKRLVMKYIDIEKE